MALAPELVDSLRGHRVVVVGDVMIDEYLRGEVHRISPEAPVPVLDLRATEHRLGGAANTAHNLAVLGAQVTLVGVVGADDGAALLTAALSAAGITTHLVADPSRPTTRKTRLVAGGHQIARVDAERRAPLDPATAAAVIAALAEATASAAAVVVSDYAKGVVTAAVAQAAIAAGRARAIPVIVDPKQRDFAAYAGATVVTPNLAELEHAVGHPVTSDDDLARAAAALAGPLAGCALLATRGADGMTLFHGATRAGHAPAIAREVFDVTGAGDTVVATLALALAAGHPLTVGMDLASLAAAIAVSRRGTATVAPADLASALAVAGRP
ncbi:MAG: D-glycero-beta-D-manno-heptose-7-phosphate kinase [Kofleriaceae bacterium]